MSWNGHPVIDLDSHIVERADRFYRRLPRSRLPRHLSAALRRRGPAGRSGQRLLALRQPHVDHRAHRGRPAPGPPRHLRAHPAVEHGRRPQSIPARPGRQPPADPARGELGRHRPPRGHGPRPGGRERPLSHARLELLRAARRGPGERALPRLSPLGGRLLRPGPAPSQVDDRGQHARRPGGRRRGPLLGGARPQCGRRLHLAPGAGGQAARQPRPLSALRRGPGARPAAARARRDVAAALRAGLVRSGRRLVPAPQLLEPVGGHGRPRGPRRRWDLRDVPRRSRVAIIETGGGWLPLALDRLDTHYIMSPGPRPQPQAAAARRPRRGPVLPRHRHVGALARVLRRRSSGRICGSSRATGRTATRRGRRASSRS